jgi:hypothetical protein
VSALRLRLSDGHARAVEFSASDARSLAAGCEAALAAYLAESRAAADAEPPRRIERGSECVLELHVAGRRVARDAGDWYAPSRPLRQPALDTRAAHVLALGEPVRVLVSARVLDRRPPDDWTEIWGWCEQTARGAAALQGFARRVATEVFPPVELQDPDREAR